MIVHFYAALHEECADECCDDRDDQVADLLGIRFSEYAGHSMGVKWELMGVR